MKKSLLIFVTMLCLYSCAGRTTTIPLAEGNGIVSCRPGLNFPRDCGNRCQCHDNGNTAVCTANACPTSHAEFDAATMQVHKELDQLKNNGTGAVFNCTPFTRRKVNNENGNCYCARSGTAEICSTRIGDPWGVTI